MAKKSYTESQYLVHALKIQQQQMHLDETALNGRLFMVAMKIFVIGLHKLLVEEWIYLKHFVPLICVAIVEEEFTATTKPNKNMLHMLIQMVSHLAHLLRSDSLIHLMEALIPACVKMHALMSLCLRSQSHMISSLTLFFSVRLLVKGEFG
jgi:hypothetical protein